MTAQQQLDIFYFKFETDFIHDNIRCIPMIARFKLDIVRIKLKLSEWVKFSHDERLTLAVMPCETVTEIAAYHFFLDNIIEKYTTQASTFLTDEKLNLSWQNIENVPTIITESVAQYNCSLNIEQWRQLSDIQRFALIKLCTSSHESHNFIHALREFGLVQ